MKKLLTSVLALAMGFTCVAGLAACTNDDGGNGKSNADIAKEAIETIKVMHNSNVGYETAANYEVYGQTRVDGTAYTVNWSVTSEAENLGDYVSVGSMNETSKQVTINVTMGEETIEYTLTASVTVGNATETANFAHKVPGLGNVMTVAEAKALAATIESGSYYMENDEVVPVLVKGYVVDAGSYSAGYNNWTNVYIADAYSATKGDDALQVYRVVSDSNFLKGEYDLEKGDLVVLSGALQNYNGKAELTYKDTLSVTCVTMEKSQISDAEKLAAAQESLTLPTRLTAAIDLTLRATANGATLTWALAETELATLEGNTLKIASIPAEAAEITVTATITAGSESATKEFKITLEPANDKGTAENPYTTAEAIALANTVAANGYYEENGEIVAICVKGYVVETGEFKSQYDNWQGVYIAPTPDGKKSDADALQVYGLLRDGELIVEIADLVKGSYIVVSGALQNYKGNTPELTFNNNAGIKAKAVVYEKAEYVEPPVEEIGTTLDLTNVANRTSVDADAQVWEANGIKLTNSKGESTSDVKDYVPIRIYAKSSVKVEFAGMNNIVFLANDNSASYPDVLKTALETAGFTATVSGAYVYVEFASATNSIEFAVSAQVRLDSVIVNADLTKLPGGEDPEQPGEDTTNYGTLEAPLSVTEALAIAAEQCKADYDVTKQAIFMKGVVTGTFESTGTYYKNLTLADVNNSATTVLVYTINIRSGVAAPKEGDTLIISGYIKNYQGTIEFASNGSNYVYIEKNLTGTQGGEDPEPTPGETDYGTLEAPLSVEDALDLATKECKNSNDVTKQVVYAIGIVKSIGETGSYYKNVYLQDVNDDSISILVYTINIGEGVTAPQVGDKVIISGYIKNYNGTIEFASNNGTFVNFEKNLTADEGGEGPVDPTPGETDYGTAEKPISVEAALAIAADECKNNNDVTAQIVYVIGVVKSVGTIGSYYSNIYIKDQTNGAKEILIYSMNKTNGVADPAQNDTIVLYGYIKNYNGTLEFASANNQYPVILSNERGTSEISVLNDGGADVSGLNDTALNGTTVTFTVTAKDGKELVSVKVNGTALTGTEGSYSFTMNGNATIAIETKTAGAADAAVLYTLSTASVKGTNNSYTSSCDMTVDGIVWNLEGNSQMNPWRLGGKSSNTSNTDRKLTSKTAISGKVTKLDIAFGAANITVNSITLKVFSSDPTADGATEVSSVAVEGFQANSTVTVTADKDWTNCYYQLVFNLTATATSNQYVTVSTIAFWGFAA